jgi:hypothetical protein
MNWLSLIGVSFSIITAIFNIVILIAIKFNDLKNLQVTVKDLKTTVEKNDDTADLLSGRVSKIEGIISVWSKKIAEFK